MKRSEMIFGLLRIPLDALAVLAALLLSYRLRHAAIDLLPGVQLLDPAQTLPSPPVYFSSFVLPAIAVFLTVAACIGLYAFRSPHAAWREVGKIIIASLLWVVFVMGWYFFVRKELFYSRILLIHSTFFIILFVCLSRASLIMLQRAFLKIGFGVRFAVSVGLQQLPRHASESLSADLQYRYLGHLADLDACRRLLQRQHIDLVLQTDPNPASEETLLLIDYCRSHHIGYAFLPPVLADVPHQLRVERLGILPLMRFQPTPLDGWGSVGKRMFDVVVSSCLLVALSPVFLVIALLILITEGRPILYVSWRVGEQGRRRIPVLKFRTMVRNADALKTELSGRNHRSDGPLFKMKHDPRVTRIGRALRRFDLDELPQLLNVILGQMSLVGPRPHLPDEVERYTQYQRRVFTVKPGLTGLAQVSGRSDLSFDEEVRLDLQYVEEWSLLLDLWILWRTGFAVWQRKE